MISSSQLAASIYADLDQNAYTTWHDDPKILEAINNAVDFVLAYARWPRSLKHDEIISTTPTSVFTLTCSAFSPYRAYLGEEEKNLSNTPIISFLDVSWTNKAYVYENTISFSETWLKANVLYHKWHTHLTSLWSNDIDMPSTMKQALLHVVLWFVYPGWLDMWSTLANQNYNQAKTLLDTYAKAYWQALMAKKAEPSNIYR